MKTKIALFALAFFFVPSLASANVIFYSSGWVEHDCSYIGTWSGNTCVMNRDVVGSISIRDANTILDGNGHTLSSEEPISGNGVEINDVNGVTVKNLKLSGFYEGISASTYYSNPLGNGVFLENNTITNSTTGIRISRFARFGVLGNTITGGERAIDVTNSSAGRIADNIVSCENTEYSSGISLYGIFGSNFVNNTVSGCKTGFNLSQLHDTLFSGNNVGSATTALSISSSPEFLRNIFTENTLHDSQIGVNFFHDDPVVVSFLSLPERLWNSTKSFFAPSAFADETADDNVFFKNDFINNTTDVTANITDFLRFFDLTKGGNFWDKNSSCVEGADVGFCNVPYVINAGLNLQDNSPRTHKMSEEEIVPTLLFGGETEDDGLIDGKGVTDKTNFTFDVFYTGTTAPSNITLLTNDGTTHNYPLTLSATTTNDGNFKNGEWYAFTATFSKGVHGYHFEANGGTTRFPATGELKFTTGYSNVAFLPGLEASRLYQPTYDGHPNTLWEPNRNADIEKLYLDASGTSPVSDIYTKDVIDNAYIPILGPNIYASFLSSLDNLKNTGVIHDWNYLPYDWRLSLDEILKNGYQNSNGQIYYTGDLAATGTPYIIQEIRRLAQTSDTGKVILVSHSNGGLVAKALTRKLGDTESSKLLEKMVFVAVPQLGTPQAIKALLHGEGLPSDVLPILMWPSVARTLGENMPSGYNLLPSAEYFKRVLDPVAKFDMTEPLAQIYVKKYGSIISNPTELHDFLLGAEGRTAPDLYEDYVPNILNKDLLAESENTHLWLDVWEPPAGVEMIQIAGWGLDTISGINYNRSVKGDIGQVVLDHEPIMTSDGDGTVVIPSAVASTTARTYYVDLPGANSQLFLGTFRNRSHNNILELDDLQKLISDVVMNVNKNEKNIYETQPMVNNTAKKLRLKIHSPVSLDLYDSFGNHTGISTSTTLGDIRHIDKQIPNSYYLEMGEGKYAGIAENGTTTIKLFGQATGTFTLDIEEIHGDTSFAITTFADIPVTASSTAILQMQTLTNTELQIKLDINGDGQTDAIISSGNGLTAQELIGVLRGLTKTLNLQKNKEDKLLTKIDKLEKAITKEYKNECKQKMKTTKAFANLETMIQKLLKKNLLTTDDATELSNILGQIKNSVVK